MGSALKFVARCAAVLALLAAGIAIPSVSPPGWLPMARAQSPSQCSFIQNADRRNLCRARAEGRTSSCGLIQDNDLRNFCRAQAGRERSSCGLIREDDLRYECYSYF
jgi:hypothetical protein